MESNRKSQPSSTKSQTNPKAISISSKSKAPLKKELLIPSTSRTASHSINPSITTNPEEEEKLPLSCFDSPLKAEDMRKSVPGLPLNALAHMSETERLSFGTDRVTQLHKEKMTDELMEIDEDIRLETDNTPEPQIKPPIKPVAIPKNYSEATMDVSIVEELSDEEIDCLEVGEDIDDGSKHSTRQARMKTAPSSHLSSGLSGFTSAFTELDLFRGSTDIGETYKMDKWALHMSSMLKTRLYKLIPKGSEELQVIGVLGGKYECEEVIRKLMSEGALEKRDTEKSSIRAYYRKGEPRLCLHFNSGNKTLFTAKPYRQTSKETIYFRLLLDLCSAVIICPDPLVKRNWYRPTGNTPPHPFVSQSFDPEFIAYESKKVQKEAIKELIGTEESKAEESPSIEFDLSLLYAAMKQDPPDLPLTNVQESIIYSSTDSPLKPKITQFTKKSSEAAAIPVHPPKILFSCDSFPYIFVQTMEPFNQDKVNKATKETLGLFLRDVVHYALKNGEIRGDDWKEFSGFCEFEKALTEYDYAEEIIARLKNRINLAISKVLMQRGDEYMTKFNKGLWDCLNVPLGYLEDAKMQVLAELEAPNDFHKICSRYYTSRPVLGVKMHAKQNAKDQRRVAEILDRRIAVESSEFMRRCAEWLNQEFGLVHKITLQELTIRPELLNSYTVELERFQLDLQITSVACFHETLTTVFRTPSAPQDTTAFVLDKNIAFSLFTCPSSFEAVKFNPDSHGNSDLAVDQRLHPDTKLVSGSTAHCFVCIKEQCREVYYGQVLQGKYISTGNRLDVYGVEVVSIRDACFLPESRLLYLINQAGILYYLDLKDPQGVQQVPGLKQKEYFQVRCSNESIFVLVSTNIYEVFEAKVPTQEQADSRLPLELRLKISTKNIGCHKFPFKLISKDHNNYIVSFNSSGEMADRIKADEIGRKQAQNKMFRVFHFAFIGDYFIKQESKNKFREIDGNPIVDGFVYALKTYGYDLARPPLPSKSFHIYVKSVEEEGELKLYPQSTPLSHYFSSFSCHNFEEIANLQVGNSSKKDLKWTIGSRQPVHVCSILDGKLIPLQSGQVNWVSFKNEVPEKAEDYITKFIQYTKLGHVEDIVKKTENPLVISIMGKQSSGKSYLLNRLFETRFDVSSNRCTDGIWLSAVKSAGRTLIILDCEGLFSVERSELEEVKLCVLLSAISDVTILNQDLAMGKYLSALLEKFERAKNRVSGNNLFKGILNIVIRDVSEPEGACEDLYKVINTLVSQRRASFIDKIFSGTIKIVPLHYFEAEEFEQEIEQLRAMYLEREAHWRNGEEFLFSMKAVLAQINSNDMDSLDSCIAKTRLKEVKNRFIEELKEPAKAGKLLGESGQISTNIDISGSSATVKFEFEDILTKQGNIIASACAILDRYFREARENAHNDYYSKVQDLIDFFFDTAEPVLKAKFTDSISHAAEFAEQISEIYKQDIMPALERYRVRMCLRQCESCKRICPLSAHDGLCNCGTDHKCRDACVLCGRQCVKLYGHDEGHMCDRKHNCGNNCHYCDQPCNKDKQHAGNHLCIRTQHQCEASCQLFQVCKKGCAKTKEIPHEKHDCGMLTCNAPCSTKGCKDRCSNPVHLHSISGNPKHTCPKHP